MGAPGVKRTKVDGALQRGGLVLSQLVIRLRRKAAALLLVALTLPVGYKAVYGTHGWISYHQEVSDSEKLDKDIAELKHRNEKTASEIKGLKTDPNVIEREAREQLRYVRPNDVVITIPQSRTDSSANAKLTNR
jgi:cell division protein FtsB